MLFAAIRREEGTRDWINEAMIRRSATARGLICEHAVAAEAEAGTAGATNHFMAFEVLRALLAERVFGDGHWTIRALL